MESQFSQKSLMITTCSSDPPWHPHSVWLCSKFPNVKSTVLITQTTNGNWSLCQNHIHVHTYWWTQVLHSTTIEFWIKNQDKCLKMFERTNALKCLKGNQRHLYFPVWTMGTLTTEWSHWLCRRNQEEEVGRDGSGASGKTGRFPEIRPDHGEMQHILNLPVPAPRESRQNHPGVSFLFLTRPWTEWLALSA